MNGPQVVCAGCAKPTSLGKPVCDDCTGLMAEVGHPICPLCQSIEWPIKAPIRPADKFGIHYTETGGYAGKCSAGSISGEPGA